MTAIIELSSPSLGYSPFIKWKKNKSYLKNYYIPVPDLANLSFVSKAFYQLWEFLIGQQTNTGPIF